MVCELYLPRGLITFVSVEDYDSLKAFKWSINIDKRGNVYVCRYEQNKRIYLHRQITGCPEGLVVDHIDGNTLNNRRSNLRVCSIKQNSWNYVIPSSLGMRGVSEAHNGKYRARISDPEFGEVHIGCYETPQEAAEAYDRAAVLLFGSYAWINFPLEKKETEINVITQDIPF